MPPSLADLTTLRLGGPIAALTTAVTDDELIDAVRAADTAGESVLLVGGGSNLVAADEGWPGRVILIRTRGITLGHVGDHVRLTASAGEPWDALVRFTVAQGWSGLETMAGIPGLTGATPVQNVGAYGAEIADVITGLTVLDRQTGAVEAWTPEQCRFGFRTSVFKGTERYVVVDVTMSLTRRPESVPIRYAELARRLGVEPGRSAPLAAVRDAVLELRRTKGMVLDDADPDTWSVGSFFVNPLLDVVPDAAKDCPQWHTDGATKLSAAWLIERAGFQRGFGGPTASLSTKHTLALTNRGGATTAQLLDLAREIQAGVQARFDVRLRPEARLAPNVPGLD
ncbi:MAG: UDP-N-acetylmuramate dehydrogenase [bacterium]